MNDRLQEQQRILQQQQEEIKRQQELVTLQRKELLVKQQEQQETVEKEKASTGIKDIHSLKQHRKEKLIWLFMTFACTYETVSWRMAIIELSFTSKQNPIATTETTVAKTTTSTATSHNAWGPIKITRQSSS